MIPILALMLLQDSDLAERCRIRHAEIPRKVLAFYYPWYGNPRVSKHWSHWEGVDVDKKDIRSSTRYPVLGPYDSHDPEVVAQHCDWAKEAGIDVLISSWWGRGDFTDRALPLILETAKRKGLEVSIYYEQVPAGAESAADDFAYLAEKYGSHPAWFRVDGKPVVFVYGRAMGQLGLEQWAGVLKRVFAVADDLGRPAARIFDGTHTYNTCGDLAGRKAEEIGPLVKRLFSRAVADADRCGRASCVTVIPGYDDTKIRKPGIRAERLDGESYRRQWEAAIELDPHWVAITSFNEWHEGSEIEPSVELGDAYLKLTAEYAKKFKSKGREARAVSAKRIPATLRKAFDGRRVAVLPGARSEAPWWLIEAGIAVDFLKSDEVLALDAKRHEFALYAGGERYRRTVKRDGDVDEALERYEKSGGCLVAMAAEPFPFFYDEKGRTVSTASRFGFNIGMGFEAPKGRLVFRSKELRFAFPSDGDRRWRPFLPGDFEEFVPLVELWDGEESLGAGAACAKRKDGARVAYVWFRLLDGPEADAILYDVWTFLSSGRSR
ncbi:MAG: hypothetical protein HYY17_04260 [Planctomycetes bacterium]|nr:hypothetical protein [Planctomycetota bacterium]